MGKIRQSLHSLFYVLYSVTKGHFKIGVSDEFDQRYKDLCSANGERLMQIFVIQCPNIADHLEYLAHGLFFERWTRHGEWFILQKPHIQELYCLLQGLFLNTHTRKKFETKPDFYYWENVAFLIDWSVQTIGPTRINCETSFP